MRPGRRGAAALVLVVAAAVGACSDDGFAPLPTPEAGPVVTTTTTVPVDYRGVALDPVGGTTSTTEPLLGPGPATLAGRVDGPEGSVAGATVRLERLVGDALASVDVVTGDDGRWSLAGVLGGRYRVRAWRIPDLAGLEPQIVFVGGGGGPTELALTVDHFDEILVSTAVAPDPPEVGERTSLRVQVESRAVDGDGVVRTVPSTGLPVRLEPAGGWAVEGPAAGTTDDEGGATFVVVCRAPGPQPLSVSLPGSVVALSLPACSVAAPPETLAPTIGTTAGR